MLIDVLLVLVQLDPVADGGNPGHNEQNINDSNDTNHDELALEVGSLNVSLVLPVVVHLVKTVVEVGELLVKEASHLFVVVLEQEEEDAIFKDNVDDHEVKTALEALHGVEVVHANASKSHVEYRHADKARDEVEDNHMCLVVREVEQEDDELDVLSGAVDHHVDGQDPAAEVEWDAEAAR